MTSNDRREECLRRVASYQGKFPDVPTLSSKELIDATNKTNGGDILLVDVRTREEQDISMIPGAIRLQDLDDELRKCEDVDESSQKTIVIYCTVG